MATQSRIGWRPYVNLTAQQLQSATYLLDSYSGTAVAYSLRKLRSSYSGSAIRVRRSSDNLEQNIGFDANGNLDTTSLSSFTNPTDTGKLLDNYSGASVAYSLRKLSATYSGSAIRVRRSGDNVEQNIGFDANGNLDTTSLLSFVGYNNIALYSEEFDNVNWNKYITTVTSNQAIAPDGTMTADLLSEASANNYHTLSNGINLSFAVGTSWNVSLYVKKGPGTSAPDTIILGFPSSGTNTFPHPCVLFNISSGTVLDSSNTSNDANFGSSIVDAGNGWWRCSVWGTVTVAGNRLQFGVIRFNNNLNTINGAIYAGNAQSNIYIWGYQFQKALNNTSVLTTQSYTKTTAIAGGSGFVTTWYDQSGSGNNAFQTAASVQPQIVNNGSIITRNSKPYIEATSSRYFQFTTELYNESGSEYSLWMTYEKDAGGSQAVLLTNGNSYMWLDYGIQQAFSPNSVINISAHATNTLYLINNMAGNSGSTQYRNSLSLNSSGAPGVARATHLPAASFRTAKITMSEFIYYPTNKTSQRALISANINGYYSIHTPNGSAFVTTWYDQSGNGRNATQTTASSQPMILSSGSINLVGGKPSIYFNGANFISSPYNVGTTNEMYFLTQTTDTVYLYPSNNTLVNYGFVAQSGNSGGFNSNYGSPQLYTNGFLKSVTNRIDVYNVLNGYKLSVHKGANLSGWSANPTMFGNYYGGGYEYTGDLQEWLIYPTLQGSQSQIESNINSHYSLWDSSIVQSGLVMNLDAGFKSSYPATGSTWYDISGSGSNNGTLTGSPIYSTLNNGIINFDGVNDYLTNGIAISDTMNTIDIWVKMKSTANVPIIYYGSDQFQSTQWTWGMGVYVAHSFSEGPMGYPTGALYTESVTLNVWKNFTMVRNDNGSVKLYKNGVLVGTKAGAGTTSVRVSTDRLYIAKAGSSYGNFDMGSVKIYNRALSASEISQNFNALKSRFGL